MYLSRVMLVAVLLGALCRCSTAPLPRTEPTATTPAAAAVAMVYVVRRAWHIDIGFAAADLNPPLTSVLKQFPAANYLEFGFGDRQYLMARHKRTRTLLSALWSGPGLVLGTGLKATPEEAFGADNVIRLMLTPGQLHGIQQFIWQTLSHPNSDVLPIADGPYGGSLFYATAMKYSALYTCNTWAAQALQSAALGVDSTGVEFSGQLWRQVQRIGRSQH